MGEEAAAGRGCGEEATGAGEGQRVSDGAEERKTTAADLGCGGGELVQWLSALSRLVQHSNGDRNVSDPGKSKVLYYLPSTKKVLYYQAKKKVLYYLTNIFKTI